MSRTAFARSMLVLACALPACGSSSSSINPAPLPWDADASSADATTPEAGIDAAVEVEAGPMVRTILVREPFGELDPGNMLHDGDFEFSGLNGMQYPWQGTMQDWIRTGATCRSGLRCLHLYPGERVLGMMVWPEAPYAELTFYGAIETKSCEKEAVGLLLRLDNYNAEPIRILPTTPEPVEGWCRYGATVEVDPAQHWWALMLAARTNAEGGTVFDQVSLRGTDTAPTELRSQVPLAPDLRQLATRAREDFSKRLRPTPPRVPKPVRNPTGRKAL